LQTGQSNCPLSTSVSRGPHPKMNIC
jgi:hypothetical protein